MNDVERLQGDSVSRPGDSTPHHQGPPPKEEALSERLLQRATSLQPTTTSTDPASCTQVTASDPTLQVIDAPPGDLIALGINLAAERLAEGKKVLLIADTSERRDAFIAALNHAGLSDVAIQIDERSSHATLLKQIGNTLTLKPPPSSQRINHQEQRDLLAARLAQQTTLLSTELQANGVTPYEALSESLRLQKRDSQSKSIDLSGLKLHEWHQARFAEAIELAHSVDELFETGVAPAKNPWRGSRLAGDLPATVPGIAKKTLDVASVLATETQTLFDALGLPAAISEEQVEKVLTAIAVIDSLESAGGDALRQVNLRSTRAWSDNREAIETAIQKKLDYARCFRDLGAKVDFFTLGSLRIREAMQIASEHQKKSFLGRAVDGQYRRMVTHIASVCAVPERVEDLIKTLGHLSRLQQIQAESEAASGVLEGLFTDTPLFGATETPADLMTEWRQRSQISSSVCKVIEAVEVLGDRTLLTLLKKPGSVYEHSSKLHEVQSLLKAYQQERNTLFTAIDFDDVEVQSAFKQQPLAIQLKRLSALAVDTDCWGSWRKFVEVSERAKARNLPFITTYGLSHPPLRSGLAPELARAWHSTVADNFLTSRPSVSALDLDRSEIVERMLTADRSMRDAFATTVARKHWEELPRFACGGEASVLHELVNDPSLCDTPEEIIRGVPLAFQAAKPLIVCAPSMFEHLPEELIPDCIILDKGVAVSTNQPVNQLGIKPELLQLSNEFRSIPKDVTIAQFDHKSTTTTAETNKRSAYAESDRITVDSFAAHLRSILERDLGLSVQTDVVTPHGVVDIAVVDSSDPSRFALCIFLDGPRYQAAPSILDEERARETAARELTGRAPQREWILEWHANPGAQKRRFISAVKHALASEVLGERKSSPREIERQPLKPEHSGLFAPYTTALLDASTARLLQRSRGEVEPLIMADVIACIVQQEGPIHRDELIARFAQLSGLRQIGDNHLLHIIEGVQLALKNGAVIMRDDCAYSSQKDQTIYPRVRGNLPGTLARFERIPPDELQAAICTLVKNAHGISQEELPTQLFSAFGYKAAPFAGDKLLQQSVRYLLEKGVLVERKGCLLLRR